MAEETLGQQNRKYIREAIECQLYKYVPDTLLNISCKIAYDFNLSMRTVRYDYIPIFLRNNVLEKDRNTNVLTLTEYGKTLQTNETEFSEKKLKEMYVRYVQNQIMLNLIPSTFEKWKETYKKVKSKEPKP